jgi:heme/copper-type cytochrome/quinol oxidase subunit 2
MPLAKAITVLMGVEIVLALCNDLNSFVTIGVMKRVLAGEVVAPAELTAVALRSGAISGLVMVLALAVTVLFCLFMPRANRNARAFGSLMTISPGWAAGWFFVPVANFWMPYQVMKEIWQGSDPDPNVRPALVEAPGLIKWWWMTYLLRGVAGPAVYFASRDENRTQAAIDLSTVTIATSVLTLIAAPLAAATVRAVARRQDERQKRHPAGTPLPLPI